MEEYSDAKNEPEYFVHKNKGLGFTFNPCVGRCTVHRSY